MRFRYWVAGDAPQPLSARTAWVHRDYRGHGYGTAITLAAAAALSDMGPSSAIVCTPSSNVRAAATYASSGFNRSPDVTHFRKQP